MSALEGVGGGCFDKLSNLKPTLGVAMTLLQAWGLLILFGNNNLKKP